MKILFFITVAALASITLSAQDNKGSDLPATAGGRLPDLSQCVRRGQEHVFLFTQNLDSNAKQKDVNTIINDFQRYIDSLPASKSEADILLAKHYAALRMFFLTTTNKTTVATSFLSEGAPFSFCTYHDTASALYLGAVKDGELYNAGRMTEAWIVRSALLNCLLPSLKALNELKDTEVKYIGLSIYYGSHDTREGEPVAAVTPFCLTLVARLSDIQQFNSGYVTAKGLLEQATLYKSSTADYQNLSIIQADIK